MENLILKIIAESGDNYFDFDRDNEYPVLHLKKQTENILDVSGLYFVFYSERIENDFEHLKFEINGIILNLAYFGKAGGITKAGKTINQGLKGRLNNVVSDSSRNLIDVKRAIYWKVVMEEYKIEKFHIIYHFHNQPDEIENSIYNYLNLHKVKYPLMNKVRGRKSNITK